MISPYSLSCFIIFRCWLLILCLFLCALTKKRKQNKNKNNKLTETCSKSVPTIKCESSQLVRFASAFHSSKDILDFTFTCVFHDKTLNIGLFFFLFFACLLAWIALLVFLVVFAFICIIFCCVVLCAWLVAARFAGEAFFSFV